MSLLTVSVQFELGEFFSKDLPRLAADLLASGVDSPSLRIVAGETQPTMAETGQRFRRSLKELGVALRLHEACLLRAESLADRIVAGLIEPRSGASDLYLLDRNFGGLPELEPFLEAYWRNPLPHNDEEQVAHAAVLRDEAHRLAQFIHAHIAQEQRAHALKWSNRGSP